MATITIKIKGIQAAGNLLASKAASAGALGAGAKSSATLHHLGQKALVEGGRELEMEGGRLAFKKTLLTAPPSGFSATPAPPLHPSASPTGGLELGAKGTLASLGFIGPILILASLGLIATGVYIYLRRRQAMQSQAE